MHAVPCIWLYTKCLCVYILFAVKVVSFLYRNLSQLLPPGNNSTSIVSPIVSSTTDCQSCRNSNLKENVVVSLKIEVHYKCS